MTQPTTLLINLKGGHLCTPRYVDVFFLYGKLRKLYTLYINIQRGAGEGEGLFLLMYF